jgi:hypothetical protein
VRVLIHRHLGYRWAVKGVVRQEVPARRAPVRYVLGGPIVHWVITRPLKGMAASTKGRPLPAPHLPEVAPEARGQGGP